MKTETKPYMPKSKNQEHITPDRVFEIIYDTWGIKKEQFYDPCPVGTPYKAPIFFNGLYGDWKPWNYVNPMFQIDTLTAFYNKAKEQSLKGNKSILLLPSKTDQEWFEDIIYRYFMIKWIRGRLKFKNNKDYATQPHFLVMIK